MRQMGKLGRIAGLFLTGTKESASTMTLTQYLRLVDVQARMMLKKDAARLRLGYLWWVLEPLLWVGVFYLVFNTILDSAGRSGIDFLVFLTCGKFAFIWFSRTVTQASGSVVANSSLVSKVDLPKTLFPMAAVQESLYRQSTVYALMFAMLIACGYPPTWSWLWLLPILATYYLMIVACSLAGAYLVCLVQWSGLLIASRNLESAVEKLNHALEIIDRNPQACPT